jgi:enoyl-CoA hydratase/carnithine racemase
MVYKYIKYENSDGIAWITLNRPEKMNSLNATMLKRMEGDGLSRRRR